MTLVGLLTAPSSRTTRHYFGVLCVVCCMLYVVCRSITRNPFLAAHTADDSAMSACTTCTQCHHRMRVWN